MVWNSWMVSPIAGELFTGVVAAEQQMEGGATRCTLVGLGLPILVDLPLVEGSRYTLYFFLAQENTPLRLTATATSDCILAQPLCFEHYSRVKELCAGIGGIGVGCVAAGAKVVAALDRNSFACTHLEQNLNCPVVLGDSTNDVDLLRLHRAGGTEPAVEAAGIPCQPFSRQGDGQAFGDPRTQAILGVLRSAYLHQAAGLILECVVEAGYNLQMQALLRAFADTMDWNLTQVVLELGAQWPMRRARWWACFNGKQLPNIALRSWPYDQDYQKLADIIGTWPVWSASTEQVLRFTEAELIKYNDPLYGSDARELDPMSKCPTILHSYAHALTGCPCQCRSPGLQERRLQRKGLRGFGVRPEPQAALRFLHASEAGILMTFPADYHYQNGRDSLPMVGQAAAPLQSLWVYAHLRRSADVHHDEFTIIEPLQLLHDYKSHLLDTMHDCWQIPNSLAPHPVLLSEADDQPYHITCQASTTVEDLLQAEDFRRSWGHTLQLFDGGRPVPRHALLQSQGRSGPYELRSVPKRQASDQPQGMIFITLHMNPLPTTFGIATGSFLFQALMEEGLDTCTPIYDAGGHPVDPSIRLWRCTTLWTSSTRGAGPVQSARAGLTGSFLHYIAANILMNSDHARRFGLPFLHLLIEDQPSLPLPALQRQLDIGGFDIILLCQGHWILLSLRKVNSGICCIGYDGLIPSTCTEEVGQFVTGLAGSLHKQLLAIRWITVFQQCAPDLCGTILLAHLVWMSGIDHALRHYDLKQLHSYFLLLERHLQALHVLPFEEHHGTGPQPVPNEAHLLGALRELLITKGVPESRAEERALLGLKKLGHSELQSALQAAQPWACLKSIASRPHFSFKWIKADELNAKIRARASDQFHVQQSENKRRPRERKQPAVTLHINPQQLSLIQSSFVDNDGQEVPQIAFQDIGQGKAGLAFGGLNELAPYLREGVTISTEALGVLTTVPIPNEMIGFLKVTNCRFPAHYQATSEPVLIQGSLVQLGAKTITRKHEDINDLDVVTTQTLRITIYKDEWTGSWNHFQERPIRGLVEVLPIFQLCRTDGCGATCPKFHSPVDQTLESLLLDIWSRSWMSTAGKFCQPKDAVAFSAMIRTPRCALSSIQSCSGSHGVYIEPRSPCGKLSDDSFGVVWIPGADLPNVKHRLSVMDKALCVCRLHNKYGLRFNHTDLQAAHSTLRPFDTFVNSRIQTVYRLFPLPFGTQRGALQHCITKWGWNAKVLQAAGGGPKAALGRWAHKTHHHPRSCRARSAMSPSP